jgi:hypothetical protein
MQPVRCSWEVRAGMIPGEAMEEYTRQFHLLTAEWETAAWITANRDRLVERRLQTK